MKLLFVLAATLVPPALATGMLTTTIAGAGGRLEQPPFSLPRQAEGQEFFIEEVPVPDGVDYSMRAVAPRDDREYFIQTPPLPGQELLDRLERGFDWLPDLEQDDPILERLNLGPYFPFQAEPAQKDQGL